MANRMGSCRGRVGTVRLTLVGKLPVMIWVQYLYMEGQQGNSLASLVHKIRHLRRKLLSYGWNKQESNRFILYEFLKLPEPEWQKPSTSLSFYQVREKYKVDSTHAELILVLQQLVPDLHQQDVLDYLHSLFQYSALNYGFEFFDSSSDSSENPIIVKRPQKTQHRPLRHRPIYREPSPLSKKKVHREQEQCFLEKKEQGIREQIRMVRKRRAATSFQLQELQKTVKKEQQK